MPEDRKPTPHEIAEREEFVTLFDKARTDIELITIDEIPNDLGIKRLPVEFGYFYSTQFSFFWNEKNRVFGVEFSRKEGKLVGQTSYNFHLEDGEVDLTGYIGKNYGNESLPDLIYAPMNLSMGVMENVRHAPLNVDLSMLRNLVKFIDNPIKNRYLITSLTKLPGEEKLI